MTKIKVILDKEEYINMLADLEVLLREFEVSSIERGWIQNIINQLENNRSLIK